MFFFVVVVVVEIYIRFHPDNPVKFVQNANIMPKKSSRPPAYGGRQ